MEGPILHTTPSSQMHQDGLLIFANISVKDGANDHGALVTARVISMLLLGGLSFLLGLLPLLIVRNVKDLAVRLQSGTAHLFMSSLLCFGAGVLFCTSLAHILPEVREAVEALQEEGLLPHTPHHLPLAEICVAGGFFLVYLVEETVHLGFGAAGHGHSHAAGLQVHPDDMANPPSKDEEADQKPRRSSSPSLPPHIHNSPSTSSLSEILSGLLLVLALSFHAVFEGLAVGLEQEAKSVWALAGAVAAHKFVISFCLGAELISAGLKKSLIVLYVATFAVVTPLGMGIGIALTSHYDESPETPTTVVLEAMAGGTLIYVVFFEVMQRERTHLQHLAQDASATKQHRFLGLCQFAALLIGFVVMLGFFNI